MAAITRKCAMCDTPVLKSNSGQQNRRCASCQGKYDSISRSLGTPTQRRIGRFLDKPKREAIERTLDCPKAEAIERFLRHEPLTEIDMMLQQMRFLEWRKAHSAEIHEQWKAALIEWGAGTGA